MKNENKNCRNENRRPLLAKKKRNIQNAPKTLRLEALEQRQMLSAMPWLPMGNDQTPVDESVGENIGTQSEVTAYIAPSGPNLLALQQNSGHGDSVMDTNPDTIVNADSAVVDSFFEVVGSDETRDLSYDSENLDGESQSNDRVTPDEIDGESQDKDHKLIVFTPDGIKGNATDDDHKDWVVTLDVLGGESQSNDRVTPDEIDGESQDKDHKLIVFTPDGIKGNATDDDHKDIFYA